MRKKTYMVEKLDCANCASKIEKKMNELDDVKEVRLVFPSKKLIVEAEDPDKVLPKLINIAKSIEKEIEIEDESLKNRKSTYVGMHQHNSNCGCNVTENGLFRRVYKVENLCCRICASRIEQKILELPYVQDVSLAFTTEQLIITSNQDPDEFIDEIQKICEQVRHDVSLSTDEEKKDVETKFNKELLLILLGAVCFLSAIIFSKTFNLNVGFIFFIAGYILLGFDVVISAVRNLVKGQVFDENFLMAVATIAAFGIGETAEAVGIMLFFKIGEYFEHRAVEKSRQSIMSAVDMRPNNVILVGPHGEKSVAAETIEKGDTILVRPGDRIPLDGIVVDGETKVDTSAITGESLPLDLKIGGRAISGYVNSVSPIKIKVTNNLNDSMVTRILESVENAAASKPKIDKFLTSFARVYTPVVVLISILVAIVPPIVFHAQWGYWLYTAISFLVISCPCALVLSVPLAFFAGIGRGSREGILFKGGATLESLARVKSVVMDKTGTITKGNFKVQDICVEEKSGLSEIELLRLAASVEKFSTHPIAKSILNSAEEKNLNLLNATNIKEFGGKGIEAVVDENQVLCGNKKFFFEKKIDITSEYNSNTEVLLAKNFEYVGRIKISDTIKQDTVETISELKKSGLFTAIVTGDRELSAKAVAERVKVDKVYYELLPEQKLDVLKKIRNENGAALFVGDGINDAPVLAGADVGAAMGSGSESAIEIADVVYMNSNVSSITESIKIAKLVRGVSKQNVAMALFVKASIMILGLTGFASMWTAVFADTGVAVLCILNSMRLLKHNDKESN